MRKVFFGLVIVSMIFAVQVFAEDLQAPFSGLLGWGLKTDVNIGYLGFVATEVIRVDVIYADPFGIANRLGCSPEAVNWKVGLGGAFGKDTTGTSFQTGALFVDNVIDVVPNAVFGTGLYVGYGLNWAFYGIGRTSGFGGQAYLGIKKPLANGYVPYAELGWGCISAGDSTQGARVNLGLQMTL
ncbi:MAG: hypothetical protein WCT39_05455 [Candidatus Margulisiibacteriota bacterium]